MVSGFHELRQGLEIFFLDRLNPQNCKNVQNVMRMARKRETRFLRNLVSDARKKEQNFQKLTFLFYTDSHNFGDGSRACNLIRLDLRKRTTLKFRTCENDT